MQDVFRKFAHWTAHVVGSPWAFIVAVLTILVWLATGPMFHFSDTWQLVINTGTTIVTFLMVFLIQRAQNKDARAMGLKLDEIIAAIEGASNRMIGVESLSEAEITRLRRRYRRILARARRDAAPGKAHSIEEMVGRTRTRGARPGSVARAGRQTVA